MRRLLATSLVVFLALGDSAFGQKDKAPVVPAVAPVAAPVVSGPPPPNTLQDGTAIKLRLAENLTSATAKAGQQVSFEVLEEVDVEGVPVIAKGAQALATVTTAEAKKSMGRGGKLDVNIDSVRLIDGEKAALSATQNAKGGGHTGAMTAGMVGTAIVFFPAAPLLLFIHGKDITIPKGTEVTAFVSGDMKLDMAKFAPAAASSAAVASAASGLTIEASVPNCDIEVDGNFVGSTPSTLNLAPGKHEIVVKKTGYQDWTRSMMVGSGAIRLSAEMVTKESAPPAP
ncbi:PEGA domain-containing protein [Edaphobacter aggregans]|uniref:PEGA domain-containing protein n=1 Tax=Edaphobacter aggregans TaxID=570835 RepID=A0A3R9Q7D7_9BACT|nr:PEGA domain-containing protein [Edaphobacter aggregans]RSL15144.1 PEGA domain-containing protein [Edaphobacter aggregans]